MKLLDLIIHPGTAYFCLFAAMILFRKKDITFGQAFMFPFRRVIYFGKPKVTDIFTNTGIVVFILGLLIALLSTLD